MLNNAFRYRYLLQFVNVYQRFLFCFTYILSGDVSYKRRQTEKKASLRWKTYVVYWLCKLSLKILSRLGTKCQNSLDQDQVAIFSGLIWIQTVCKGYQLMTEVGKAFHMSMKMLCIGSHYMLKLCFTVRPSEYDQKIHIHRL